MKIHQLPIGARFEYEGEEYVKTGPLFATGKGGQRLIPKYAILKPLGDLPAAPEKSASASLRRADALRAVEAFYADCRELVPQDRQADLEAARARCLKSLA